MMRALGMPIGFALGAALGQAAKAEAWAAFTFVAVALVLFLGGMVFEGRKAGSNA